MVFSFGLHGAGVFSRRSRVSNRTRPQYRRLPTRALWLEPLEDRRLLSVVDLTSAGAMGMVNGAIFEQFTEGSSGTGLLDSFVRIQANGTEQGYNTDGAVEFDTKVGAFTHSEQLANIPTVVANGITYREFALDINQGNPTLLSLDQLKFYVDASPSLTGYPGSFPAPVYDLDQGGDSYIKLDQSVSGSGSGLLDMLALIPSSVFGNDDSK